MLSKALALHLASLGLVRYPADQPGSAVRCYVEDMPGDAPDNLVLIRSQQGFPATDISGYENPELEIMRRTAADAGVQAGFDGAQVLRRAIKDDGQIVWAPGTEHEVHIALVNADATPTRKGVDPKGRPVWSFSVQTHALEAQP
ncbi:minor capsid protein [Lentzea sp. NBRC 105346]|uniref:phage tail terminator protein n=1 Tax=Lentzea sp. NBRC 105346 TaxID=3032205 RepID=UPI00255586E2|nr:minor capsid protein [Lentzea sp. NBRC 105346]